MSFRLSFIVVLCFRFQLVNARFIGRRPFHHVSTTHRVPTGLRIGVLVPSYHSRYKLCVLFTFLTRPIKPPTCRPYTRGNTVYRQVSIRNQYGRCRKNHSDQVKQYYRGTAHVASRSSSGVMRRPGVSYRVGTVVFLLPRRVFQSRVLTRYY